MSKFKEVRDDLRVALVKLVNDHGLLMTDTSDGRRTTIQLLADPEAEGAPRHPMRVEVEIWKPLNEDHSVAEDR